jgi:hypothetical protein
MVPGFYVPRSPVKRVIKVGSPRTGFVPEAPSWIKREHFMMDKHIDDINSLKE